MASHVLQKQHFVTKIDFKNLVTTKANMSVCIILQIVNIYFIEYI
jgi:hypothetical protein